LPSKIADDAGRGTGLRGYLRDATAEAHTRLDGLMSQLDLSDAEQRDTFTIIQHRGFQRLSQACNGQAAEATPLLHRTLSRTGPDDTIPADAPLDPDAVAYVALGSQLGLTMMRRSLDETQQTGIFADPPDIPAWKAFAARTASLPTDTPAAARTVRDARRAFDIFHEEAARHITISRETA
jgi:heme oxygenase (biliverdin-IX-beta and delta-forming)